MGGAPSDLGRHVPNLNTELAVSLALRLVGKCDTEPAKVRPKTIGPLKFCPQSCVRVVLHKLYMQMLL